METFSNVSLEKDHTVSEVSEDISTLSHTELCPCLKINSNQTSNISEISQKY